MVTMKQIANRAGVSISTVSLVLNNRDIGRVSPDVAERVRDIAAELGYLTNRLASGLRTSSTRTIGFLSDEVATTPFAGRMIEGAQDAAACPRSSTSTRMSTASSASTTPALGPSTPRPPVAG